MRTRVRRSEFLSKLSLHTLSERDLQSEAYKYVRLTLGPSIMKISSIVPEAAIFTDIGVIDPQKSGLAASVNILAWKLKKLVEAIPEENIEFDYAEKRKSLKVNWNGGHTLIPSCDSHTMEYMEDDNLEGDIQIPSSVLLDVLDKLLFVLVRDTNRQVAGPVYKGFMHMCSLPNNMMDFAATDGTLLCLHKLAFSSVLPCDLESTFSLRTMEIVEAALERAPKDSMAHIKKNGNEVLFHFVPDSSIRIYTRAASITFPNYNSIIPVGGHHSILIEYRLLHDALKRAVTLEDSFLGITRGTEENTVEFTARGNYSGQEVIQRNTLEVLEPYPGHFSPVIVHAARMLRGLEKFNKLGNLCIDIYAPGKSLVITQQVSPGYWQFLAPCRM